MHCFEASVKPRESEMNNSNQESTSDDEPGLRETDDTWPTGVPTFGEEELRAARHPREEGPRARESGDVEAVGEERPEGAWVRSATSPTRNGSGARRTGLGPRARQFRPMRLSFEDISRKRDRSRPEDDDRSWY